MRQRTRLVAGAAVLAMAGAVTAAQSSTATAGPVSHVTRYDRTDQCQVALRGGLKATVSVQNGQESARLVDPSAAKGGVFTINSGGHQILLPAAALADLRSGAADISAYDTAQLAERTCGTTTPQAKQPASKAKDSYRLGRLTIRTLDSDGAPGGFDAVMLLNVDDQKLVTTDFLTVNGVGRMSLPMGHYAALAFEGTLTTSSFAFVINPEFTLNRDTTITLDKRTATVRAATPTTPRPAVLESSSVDIGRSDGTGPGDWISFFNLDPNPATFMFNRTGTVRHGGFVVDPSFELNSPPDATEPYHYHVAEPFDHVPAAFPAKVDPKSLATVRRDYGSAGAPATVLSVNVPQTPWQAAGGQAPYEGFSQVQLGGSRTEYFTTGPTPLLWDTVIDGDAEINTPWHAYRPGTTTQEHFHTGPEHPGVFEDLTGVGTKCPACASGGALQFGIYPVNDNMPGDVALEDFPGASSFELRRGDKVLAQQDGQPLGVSVTAPAGRARYQLTEQWTRNRPDAPLSTASQTTWTFTADSKGTGARIPANWTCLDDGHDCSVLPLLYAYYTADGTLLNDLPAGAHTLTMDVEHQQHSVAPAITGAAVSVSYDDGATWTPAKVTGDGGRYHASFTVPASGTNGYASIRISAWDKAGNRIDQTVRRAYSTR